ncbi:MAG: hypothetical protein DHS80DRAFT_17733 [Piptocephalis tieghemiana]|nr:MAG: hypothetical protein DHS80DRAFT_17733 [Piptocephalis tieghemiana]
MAKLVVQIARLEIVRDFLQIIGLFLSTVGDRLGEAVKWLLDYLPGILGLRFESLIRNTLVLLVVLCVIVFITLFAFSILRRKDPKSSSEGFEVNVWGLRTRWSRRRALIVVFILTTLYLPLSQLALSALVWSSLFWPVDNPYKKGIDDPPSLHLPASTPGERAPGDFCYTRTMELHAFNTAWIVILLALLTLFLLTFYFPLTLHRLVRANLPVVSWYDSDGRMVRDLDAHYRKALARDRCPYSFLYASYSYDWSGYKVLIMGAKFLTIVVVVVVSKDNCLLRHHPRQVIEAIRQGLLIFLTSLFLLVHWRFSPYLTREENLSQAWSRATQVFTAILLLPYVLGHGISVIPILLIVTTSLAGIIIAYYILRGMDLPKVWVKRLLRRLSYEETLFAARSPENEEGEMGRRIRHRVWQESWAAMILCLWELRLPRDLQKEGQLPFLESPSGRAPYLLAFEGTVAERFLENARILRHIGLQTYERTLQMDRTGTGHGEREAKLRERVMEELVGPDVYYPAPFLELAGEAEEGIVKSFWGKAYVIPFPWCVVIVYDEDAEITCTLSDPDALECLLRENTRREVEEERVVRRKLRALDNQIIRLPATSNSSSGQEQGPHRVSGEVEASEDPSAGRMSKWERRSLLKMWYKEKEMILNVTDYGLPPFGQYQLTPKLEAIFAANEAIIDRELGRVYQDIAYYRAHWRDEARRKRSTLSYTFTPSIYGNARIPRARLTQCLDEEVDPSSGRGPMRNLVQNRPWEMEAMFGRMEWIGTSALHRTWYVVWDEVWRYNWSDIPSLRRHPEHFSPYYPTSLCYRPMSRRRLEAYLGDHYVPGWRQRYLRMKHWGYVHPGFLNRLYALLHTAWMAEWKEKEEGAHQGQEGTRPTEEDMLPMPMPEAHVSGERLEDQASFWRNQRLMTLPEITR